MSPSYPSDHEKGVVVHDDLEDPSKHSSPPPTTDVPSLDPTTEARLLRKLDRHIIPLVMALYLLSFLDRVNIGNARLYGLEADLSLTADQYQTAVSLLFVTYTLSELPSNLVLKKFHPSRWISFITTSWGVVATLTGVVQSYGGLVACRLLLGLVEGGLFPGMVVYLTLFYTKRELALRVGYLFVSAALAGAVGGLLAYGIGFMDGVSGQRGWRWIMILEGLPAFVLGLATWWLMADGPETAFYLNDEERALMVLRTRRQAGRTSSADEFHRADVVKGLLDWKIWVFCAAQFGANTMLYGYSTFLPTIIKGLGKWDTAETQALTVPCYLLGAISFLLVAWISDRQQIRGLYACVFGLVSVVGYGVLISDSSSGVHYFGCFLVAMGLYVLVGIPLSWLPSNQPRYGKRTTASGLQIAIGNVSGVMAPFLYKTGEAPRYVRGQAVTLGLVASAALLHGSMSLYLRQANKQREVGRGDFKVDGMSEAEVAELGDESPNFRYTI